MKTGQLAGKFLVVVERATGTIHNPDFAKPQACGFLYADEAIYDVRVFATQAEAEVFAAGYRTPEVTPRSFSSFSSPDALAE